MKISDTVSEIVRSRTYSIDTNMLDQETQTFLLRSRSQYSTVKLGNGAIYIGPWLGKELHGYGFCFFSDHSYYLGNWEQGLSNG